MIIDGKKEAAALREEIKKEIISIKSKTNKVPGLTVILIGEFAPNTEVIKIGSSKLVELAEQKFDGKDIDLKLLEKELSPFFDKPALDTVILACTHFPLLNPT